MKYKDRIKGDDCNQSGLEASSDKFNRGRIARKSKAFERNNDQDKTYKDSIHGGKADLKLPSDFPKAYIEKGVAVEMEHTDDPMLATEIAIDHLTEFPEYYKDLEIMEKKLSDRKKNNPSIDFENMKGRNKLFKLKITTGILLYFSKYNKGNVDDIYDFILLLTGYDHESLDDKVRVFWSNGYTSHPTQYFKDYIFRSLKLAMRSGFLTTDDGEKEVVSTNDDFKLSDDPNVFLVHSMYIDIVDKYKLLTKNEFETLFNYFKSKEKKYILDDLDIMLGKKTIYDDLLEFTEKKLSDRKKENPSTWKQEGYTLHYIDTNAWGEKISEPSVYAFLGKKEVGFFNTIRKEDGLHGSGIMVENGHRGKGLAKAMLDIVELKTGEKLLEASYMYEDGKKLWEYHMKKQNPSTWQNEGYDLIVHSNKFNKRGQEIMKKKNPVINKARKEENDNNVKNSNPSHLKLVDDKSFQIIESRKYSKIGFNEVVGLKTTLMSGIRELIKFISNKAYWQEKDLKSSVHEVEYISRDGFSAYSHNKGGIRINITIPKCEESDWPFLEFGEYDENDYDEDGELIEDCDADGCHDANLDIMFKLEDVEDNRISFYICVTGGNQDVPYFSKTPIIYESEFEAESLSHLMSTLRKEIEKLLKWFKDGYKNGPIKLEKDVIED